MHHPSTWRACLDLPTTYLLHSTYIPVPTSLSFSLARYTPVSATHSAITIIFIIGDQPTTAIHCFRALGCLLLAGCCRCWEFPSKLHVLCCSLPAWFSVFASIHIHDGCHCRRTKQPVQTVHPAMHPTTKTQCAGRPACIRACMHTHTRIHAC